MSIYIGKDVNGKSLLHIYNPSILDPVNIKSAVAVPGTAFHSSMDYLSCKTYFATSVEVAGADDYYVLFPSEAFTDIFSTTPRKAVILVVDNKMHTISQWANVPDCTKFWYNLSKTSGSNELFAAARYARIGNESITPSTSGTYLLVLNITIGADIVATANSATDIRINNTDITINSNSIFNTLWLSKGIVNSVDRTFSIYGRSFQIINSAYTPGTLQIYSDTYNTVVNSTSGRQVLSTLNGFYPIYKQNGYKQELATGFFTAHGGSTEYYTLQSNIPSNASYFLISLLFKDTTYTNGVDINVILEVNTTSTAIAVYVTLAAVFYIYLVIENGSIKLKSVSTGNSKDTLVFRGCTYVSMPIL